MSGKEYGREVSFEDTSCNSRRIFSSQRKEAHAICIVPYLCQLLVTNSINNTISGDNRIPDSVRNGKQLLELLAW